MRDRAVSRQVVLSGGDRDALTTAGMLAARTWLTARGLSAPTLTRWHAMIALGIGEDTPTTDFDDRTATRFHIEIFSEEWGFFFCHRGHASWVRITDIPFRHGRDDFQLLAQAPALKDIGPLLRRLEHQHAVQFRRDRALVRTNLSGSEPTIRRWVESL